MDDKKNIPDDASLSDEAWLKNILQLAAPDNAPATIPLNPQSLARRLDNISEQLSQLAQCFNSSDEHSMAAYVQAVRDEDNAEARALMEHLPDDIDNVMAAHIAALENLTLVYKENAITLRELSKPDADKDALKARAEYWMSELAPSITTMERARDTITQMMDAIEAAMIDKHEGKTPWEAKQINDSNSKLVQGMKEEFDSGAITPDKLKDYVQNAIQQYSATTFNKLDRAIIDASSAYRVLVNDLAVERVTPLIPETINALFNPPPEQSHKRE